MSRLYANPYINFRGRCREAMEFYHQALGGKLDLLAMEPGQPPKPAKPGDQIMHSRLESDGAVIMGTDGMKEYPPTVGDNIAIALGGYDFDRLSQAVDMLAGGGKMKQPLKKESWGDSFAWFEDKFGINWMVNVSHGEEPKEDK